MRSSRTGQETFRSCISIMVQGRTSQIETAPQFRGCPLYLTLTEGMLVFVLDPCAMRKLFI